MTAITKAAMLQMAADIGAAAKNTAEAEALLSFCAAPERDSALFRAAAAAGKARRAYNAAVKGEWEAADVLPLVAPYVSASTILRERAGTYFHEQVRE